MTISEAQKAVDKWIQEIGKRYFSPLTNMALLTEETGELARVIARTYGDQVAKDGDLRHPETAKRISPKSLPISSGLSYVWQIKPE